jgi:hypothetical protein
MLPLIDVPLYKQAIGYSASSILENNVLGKTVLLNCPKSEPPRRGEELENPGSQFF